MIREVSVLPASALRAATEEVSDALFPFLVSCLDGDIFVAESLLLDLIADFIHKNILDYQNPKHKILLFKSAWKSLPVNHASPLAVAAASTGKFYQLPLLQRAVLYLKVRENFPFKIIAEIIGVINPEAEFTEASKRLLQKNILSWEVLC